jgi:hypothetical protein
VTIAIGYLRFARRDQPSPTAVASDGDATLAARVFALEYRFEALRRALQD